MQRHVEEAPPAVRRSRRTSREMSTVSTLTPRRASASAVCPNPAPYSSAQSPALQTAVLEDHAGGDDVIGSRGDRCGVAPDEEAGRPHRIDIAPGVLLLVDLRRRRVGRRPRSAARVGAAARVLGAERIEPAPKPVRQAQVRVAQRRPMRAGRRFPSVKYDLGRPVDLFWLEVPRPALARGAAAVPDRSPRGARATRALFARRQASRPMSRTTLRRNSFHCGRMRSGRYCCRRPARPLRPARPRVGPRRPAPSGARARCAISSDEYGVEVLARRTVDVAVHRNVGRGDHAAAAHRLDAGEVEAFAEARADRRPA